jgi:hypothetical protein
MYTSLLFLWFDWDLFTRPPPPPLFIQTDNQRHHHIHTSCDHPADSIVTYRARACLWSYTASVS